MHKVGRTPKGEYDASGNKIRKTSSWLQSLGIGAKDPDPAFAKHALRIASLAELVFTVFACLVIVELFVKKREALIAVHSVRLVAMFTIASLAIYSIFRGHVYPEVNLYFYVFELLMVLTLNISALVVMSINLANKRKANKDKPIKFIDIVGLIIPIAIIVLNLVLLGQQIYRFRLGKRTTPMSMLFNILVSILLMFVSAKTIYNQATNQGEQKPQPQLQPQQQNRTQGEQKPQLGKKKE